MDFSSNPIIIWLDNTAEFFKKHQRVVILGLTGIALASAAGTAYWYYKGYVREQSHKAFVEALKYYDGTIGATPSSTQDQLTFANEEEKWTKTAQAFNQAHSDYSSSELAPLCKVMEAEAFLNLGQTDKAHALLESSVDAINNDAMRDFYRIKLALIKIDTEKETEIQKGINILKTLSDNAQSPAHESALYYLGAYYWTKKEFNQARNCWQMLLVKYGAADTKHQSTYAEKVKEKLALLNVESL